MGPEQLDEIRQACPETLKKFHRLLDRIRHLQPSVEIQRKLLRGLLECQEDAGRCKLDDDRKHL
jgi:hypothetical protein